MSEIKKIYGSTTYSIESTNISIIRSDDSSVITLKLRPNIDFQDDDINNQPFEYISKEDFFRLVDLFIEAKKDLENE